MARIRELTHLFFFINNVTATRVSSDVCRDILKTHVLLLYDGAWKITTGPKHGQLYSVPGTKGYKTLKERKKKIESCCITALAVHQHANHAV